MLPSQQRDLLLQTHTSNHPHPRRWLGWRWNRGRCASLVVLSQDDLVHEWHAPTGTHSSPFQAEKAALKEAIQWLSSISSWATAIIICDCKSPVQAVSNANSAETSVIRPTSVWPPMTSHYHQTGQSLPHWPAIICPSSSPSTPN